MGRLSRPVRHLRAAPARGIASKDLPAVERDGGDYGAGLIRGVAVCTRGEALGHGMWLDAEFVKSVALAINANKAGVKARFTHPGLSSDGMGKFLGRLKNGWLDGDVARGDLHLSETAHNTPDGDLAEYVMSLAEEDPSAFGTSIVFDHDFGAEDRFEADNTDKDGSFASPDPDNVQGYPHARLSRLWADDVVDEPAANPDGLFHRGDEIAAEADGLLSYALGLSDQTPQLSQLDVDPGRVAGFVARFLDQHGLEVVRKMEVSRMSDTTKPGAPDPEKPADVNLEKERLAALKSQYGTDPAFVLEMFDAGKSMAEAKLAWLERENAKQAEALAAQAKELEALKAGQPKSGTGGAKPVAFTGDAGEPETFMQKANRLAAERKQPVYRVMQELSVQEPALHEAYIADIRGR